MSLERLTVGFIPLVDAGALIVAADKGFAAEEGIALDLVREISWSNIRDRLTLGHFQAAHLLAPLAISTTLGLAAVKVALAVPMALNLNGNAITVTPTLYDEIASRLPAGAGFGDPKATGRAFAAYVRDRRASGDERPTLGMTFPFSTHNYQLRLWLAAAGLDPDDDVQLAVVPPPFMVDALSNAHVDGFCVGAPWNSVAVDLGLGRILHLGTDLVRRCPEKVLAVRADWLGKQPETGVRLVRAVARAAEWCDREENRAELADLLAARNRLDVDAALIRRTLDGRLPTGAGEVLQSNDYLVFARDGAGRPDPCHAAWLHAQMVRWGQATDDPAQAAAAEAVYRPEVFDAAIGGGAPAGGPKDGLGVLV